MSFSDLAPFVVVGVATGSLYGLAAAGLVLTYKTSGIFNFAHGAVGAAAAFVFYDLRDVVGIPWPLAAFVAIGVLAPAFGALLSLVAARLDGASTVRRVVATVGLLLAIQGAIVLRYGSVPIPFQTSLPDGVIELFGTFVGHDQLITIAVSIVSLAGLAGLFSRTRLGLQMRAVVDNSELVDLAGGSPRRIRALSWMIGATFAALSGVLFAGIVALDSLLLTLLVVQAFGAAAVGRFQDLKVTFVAGVGIGVVQALLRSPDVVETVPFLDLLPGLDASVSFLVLFGVLLVTRRGTFSEPQILRAPRTSTRVPTPALVPMLAATATGLIALPLLLPTRAPVLIQGAVFVTIFASLYLLVEVSGQVSLAHVTFVAVGATSFAHFTTGAGLPWLVGVVLASLMAVPIGALVAIPAIRLAGVFLALATFGFGILFEQMVYTRPVMFGQLGQRSGSRPSWLGLDSDAGYFYLCAAVAVAAIVTVIVVRRARLGRLLDALADSPLALATHGASTNVTRVLVFCLSASMAAAGGALLVGVVGTVSNVGVSPAALISFNSLLWLAALACVGRHPVVSPVAASFALVVAPSFVSGEHVASLMTVGFGFAALSVSLYGESISAWLAARAPAVRAARSASPVRSRLAPAHSVGPGVSRG